MSTAFIFLVVLFFLTIANALSMKVSSHRVDPRAAPLFLGSWTLIGLAVTWPFLGARLWQEVLPVLAARPELVLLAVLKGALMHSRTIRGQKLTKVSLSSNSYVRPMSIGLVAVVNYALGETLTAAQWGASMGLCLLSVGFFFKGHLADFTRQEKIHYADLVLFNVALAAIDFVVIRGSNWLANLLIYNVVLVLVSAFSCRRAPDVLKNAFLNPSAALAGFLFAVTEQVKFYQQVTINPISLVLTVQSLTQPVVMGLSALIWKERTVKEQLAWGMAAFVLVTLPFLVQAL